MARIIEETLLGLEKANVIGFHDFSIGNRQLWDNLPDDIRKEIIIDGENIRFTNNDYIPLSLFRNFKATGNRKTFEDVYFAKRRKLSDAVIAECAENEGRFISVIEEGIWSLLSEPSWVIPAHNSYVRDTEQLDTPLTERPVLDLFACETGEILALTAAVLGRKLNPIILKNIYSELERRIAKPYIEDSFWWMGSEGPLINWSPWCTQNVLIAVLSDPGLEDKTRMKAVKQAIGTLEGFIASYSEDGACDEGAGYYHAAALSLFGALLVLERSSGRDFSKVFRNQKIYNMASYIEDVFIADDLYLNYADCSPKAGTLTCREYLFAKAVGNDAMAHHAARDVAKYGWKESDNSYNLYYKLLALSSYNEAIAEASRERIFRKPPFKAFSRTDLAIYREDDITFAIKGGCNAESHNHNDVGSIILYKGTAPILVDIGVETYTKTTFSKDRYTLKPMQSAYHNVVNFPPLQQKDGKEYMAEDVVFTKDSATLSLRHAYPADDRLRSYIRHMSFDRDRKIIRIEEETDTSLTPVLSLMTLEKPAVNGNSLEFDSFRITFDSDIEAEIEDFPVTDARLRIAWPDMLYRSLIKIGKNASWTISFK